MTEAQAATVPVVAWLWFAGLLVQSVVFAVIGTWWVSKLIAAIREEIKTERKEVDQSIADAENDWRERIAASERAFGETVAAIRQHLHDFQLFVRDHYVRRDSFQSVNNDVKQQIREVGEMLDRRIGQLEKKVDRQMQTRRSEE